MIYNEKEEVKKIFEEIKNKPDDKQIKQNLDEELSNNILNNQKYVLGEKLNKIILDKQRIMITILFCYLFSVELFIFFIWTVKKYNIFISNHISSESLPINDILVFLINFCLTPLSFYFIPTIIFSIIYFSKVYKTKVIIKNIEGTHTRNKTLFWIRIWIIISTIVWFLLVISSQLIALFIDSGTYEFLVAIWIVIIISIGVKEISLINKEKDKNYIFNKK